MTSAIPVITICPSCEQILTCDSACDQWGMLHPLMPLSQSQQITHAACDQGRIQAALSRSAYHLSKVTVYKIRGD